MTAAAAPFDPRTTLARPDLAEQALEGLVPAADYRATEAMRCASPVADIRNAAGTDAQLIDQLLFGEAFDVLERRGDRLWGQARRDGAVGWVAAYDLGPVARPTRWVSSISADLPLNALVGDEVAGASPFGAFEQSPIEVAERLLGRPHRLGARSSFETDCSGLVQQALLACGLAGPRWTDQQAQLGAPVPRDEARRGDLILWLKSDSGAAWSGHSAFMSDTDRVLHATGHHGAVVIEALAEAEARYAADGFDPPIFRRLPL